MDPKQKKKRKMTFKSEHRRKRSTARGFFSLVSAKDSKGKEIEVSFSFFSFPFFSFLFPSFPFFFFLSLFSTDKIINQDLGDLDDLSGQHTLKSGSGFHFYYFIFLFFSKKERKRKREKAEKRESGKERKWKERICDL